jgi:chromosomal replication initiator protein
LPKVPDRASPLVEADSSASKSQEDLELNAIWEAVVERLRSSLPDSTFKLWLEPLRASGVADGTLYIKAPDGIRAWVERRYAGLIEKAIAQISPEIRSVSFEAVGPANEGGNAPTVTLNPSYTFDRFVIGEGNRLAHAAALAVAEAPAEAYNPLFLHGPPGLGKTHLLAAIANYLGDSAPQLNIRYTTAESFTNEFVAALRASGAEAFKRLYRDLDVLLIDDVQFLEGKRHTEEEFFHTFNALYESGSQLVLSADRMPSELSTLEERLRSRFEWGLTVSVEQPNLAMRLIVLRRLVQEAGVEVADSDALTTLARRIDANVRHLHGALTRVLAHASLRARPVSSQLVEEIIPIRTGPGTGIVEQIQTAVSREFGVEPAALCGRSREQTPLRARQTAMYLCRELTDLSLPQIGREFGGRDHATVLNAIQRVKLRKEADDPETLRQLDAVRSSVHSNSTAAA